tara:strand:- start:73 stop:537 length:465 start_codon:yes stop_codon:yes gene_type:complete
MSDTINNDDVKTLVDQLKDNNQLAKKATKQSTELGLPKEELETFILDNSAKLIRDSLDTLGAVKDYVMASPDAESVHSLAELYKASSTALDTLNKILIQNKRVEGQVAVKVMDIEAKKQLSQGTEQAKITFTRDEIFEKLFKKAEVIDITQQEE